MHDEPHIITKVILTLVVLGSIAGSIIGYVESIKHPQPCSPSTQPLAPCTISRTPTTSYYNGQYYTQP